MRWPGIHFLRTAIINAITGGVAFGLAANRRANREIEPRPWPPATPAPFVEVIIPARDEERNIAPLLATLLRQSYPAGRWGVTVVDDGSEDGTARIVREVAAAHPSVRLVRATPPPEGWTGKNNALWTGLLHAPPQAEWLLLIDADTRHGPEMLSSVVLRAGEVGADLLSLVINVEMESFWERVLVPQVGELYTLLVGTMDAVNKRGAAAAANGQFILIKQELYRRTGNLPGVRGDVAEDRALAAACKGLGATIRLEYGRRLVTSRVYSSLPQLWRGYSKTLFWASGHNSGKTLLVALSLALYAILPPLALLYAFLSGKENRREALAHGALQIAPMLLLRAAVSKQMGLPPAYALTYPLAVAVGDAMLLYSLYRVVSGRGVEWKGRVYKK